MDNWYGIDITCRWYGVWSVGYVVWVVSTKFHPFQSSLLVVKASKSLLPWKFGMTQLLTLSFSILSSVSVVSGALIGSVWGSRGIIVATFELFPFPFPLTFFLVGWCSPSSESSITAAAGVNNSRGGGTIQTSKSRPSGTVILSWAAELTEFSS